MELGSLLGLVLMALVLGARDARGAKVCHLSSKTGITFADFKLMVKDAAPAAAASCTASAAPNDKCHIKYTKKAGEVKFSLGCGACTADSGTTCRPDCTATDDKGCNGYVASDWSSGTFNECRSLATGDTPDKVLNAPRILCNADSGAASKCKRIDYTDSSDKKAKVWLGCAVDCEKFRAALSPPDPAVKCVATCTPSATDATACTAAPRKASAWPVCLAAAVAALVLVSRPPL